MGTAEGSVVVGAVVVDAEVVGGVRWTDRATGCDPQPVDTRATVSRQGHGGAHPHSSSWCHLPSEWVVLSPVAQASGV